VFATQTQGVRALVMQDGKESSVSRSHQIADGEKQGLSGLITVLGGKITGYRAIAEEATDLAARKLGIDRRGETAQAKLPGGAATPDREEFRRQAGEAGVAVASADHLLDFYGSRAASVLAIAREDQRLARPLDDSHPEIGAQVLLAMREEFCVHLEDFLVRRTGIAFSADQGQRCAEAAAALMEQESRWDTARKKAEFARWEAYLTRTAPAGVMEASVAR
jgi:glycerol-3-phosphate dehydrogenase